MDFLNHPETDRIIAGALQEDVHEGDHTTLACIPAEAVQRARCLVKDEGIIAGVALAERIFKRLDPEMKFELMIPDGSPVKYGDVPFYIEGRTQAILTGERLALNCMQRMSGIATITHTMNAQLPDCTPSCSTPARPRRSFATWKNGP